VALDVALTVQQELQCRIDDADRLRQKQVDRAQYEADLARRRFMQVDPDNRLEADSLEAEWNSKLRTLSETQQERERQREQDRKVLTEPQRATILALATNFPALWRDPNTPDRERKRMIRLLLEDITLLRGEQITLHIRFKGGAVKTLTLPLPLNSWQLRQTSLDVVKEMDRLGGSFASGLFEAAPAAARCRISSRVGYPLGTTPPAIYRKELIYEFIRNIVRPCFYVVRYLCDLCGKNPPPPCESVVKLF
jgi:hypothetical protein